MFSCGVSSNSKEPQLKFINELPAAKLCLPLARLWSHVHYPRAIILAPVTISALFSTITITLTSIVYDVAIVTDVVLTNAAVTPVVRARSQSCCSQ